MLNKQMKLFSKPVIIEKGDEIMKESSTQEKAAPLDPFKQRIQEEVEEFLQDLTLSHPFQNIFESLRRWDFQDRFGPKVIPIPKKPGHPKTEEEELRLLLDEIQNFLERLEQEFGLSYSQFIRDRFRYYTQNTSE
ncbi:MAG: hypothetical protein EA369_00350 [Bradymonadales bacterium]|nr:MAG: hypothetical protein EA369_00350 [Bradymonadales bacterium]